MNARADCGTRWVGKEVLAAGLLLLRRGWVGCVAVALL